MKLVEKKCPSCGAGLKFNENDTNVVCEYCNKTYYLHKDEKKIAKLDEAHLADAYKFINEFGKPLMKGPQLIIPFIIFTFAIIGIFISIVVFNQIDNKPNIIEEHIQQIENEEKDKYEKERKGLVQKLSQIDKTSLETFSDASKTELKNYNGNAVSGSHSDFSLEKDWTPVGVYFLMGKEDNINKLYDVVSHTYKEKATGKKTTLYAAVRYINLKYTSDKIVNHSYSGMVEAPSVQLIAGDVFSTGYGYASLEKLYNVLIRSQSGDFTIEASEGMYKEN